MATLYQDKTVTIDDSGIVIPKYYFPTLRPRRIPWSDLKSANLRPMTLAAGKYRVWGMSLAPYWFNWDLSRLRKSEYIVLDTYGSGWVKPAITPDDPAVAYSIIQEKLQSSAAKTPL